MILIHILFVFLFFLHSSVSSIMCYHCYSTKSWEDCNHNALELNCTRAYLSQDFNACLVQYIEIPPKTVNDTRTTKYVRRCASKKRCMNSLEEECRGMCKVRCCDTHRCNGPNNRAESQYISFFTLISGIIYTMVLNQSKFVPN